MRFQAQRGTADVLPGESAKWQYVESTFRQLTGRYGYHEIRTPTFEDTELFTRSSGETSEIVTKQMYTFNDKGDRSLTLKPEGTAPVMRSLIENNLCPQGTVTRLSYITPFFRYERPQKGRMREGHQLGLELVGSSSPRADAEIIEITVRFYEAVGVPEPMVLLNSLGRDECRARFRDAILEAVAPWLATQSEEDQARARKNPLRLLDSKDPAIQEIVATVPPVLNFLEDESGARFEALQGYLTEAGVPFKVAPEVVRGLDYYTETVFEVHSAHLGAQSALCGGGRYDTLIKELGGAATPSVGVGMGIERLMIVLDSVGKQFDLPGLDAFLIMSSPTAASACRTLARDLRNAGLAVMEDIDERSMKSQLRQADKSGAKYALLIGDDELAGGFVTVKLLASAEQHQVPLGEVAQWLTSKN
jgi:histidyl-tRNA synthetase